MKIILKYISFLCIILMLTSSLLSFMDVITPDTNKTLLLVLTIAWFTSAPYWMLNKEKTS